MRKKHARNAWAPTRKTFRVVEARAPAGSYPVPYDQSKSLGEKSNGCVSLYLTSLTPFRDLACPVTIRSVKNGRSSGCLDSYTQTKLVARHGACLNFARDGLPARYSKVVVAKNRRMGRIRNLLLSMKGIEIESQLTDRGPHRPLRVRTVPNDYVMLWTNNAKTIHLNTNPVNIYYG